MPHDSRNVKLWLLAIDSLRYVEPMQCPDEFSNLKKINPVKINSHRAELREFHRSNSYTDYVLENKQRNDTIGSAVMELWEPYNNAVKGSPEKHSLLDNLRLLRNRHHHGLLNLDKGDELGYLVEIKSAHRTIDSWCDFFLRCIEEMAVKIELPEELKFESTNHLLEHARLTAAKLELHRSDVDSTLSYLWNDQEWNRYTEVIDERGRSVIDHLADILQPKKGNFVVQVSGEGGLGKTALLKEYIRRNVKGPVEGLYEQYLLLSSKSEQQGEVDTSAGKEDKFSTIHPDYDSTGPVRFVEGLRFQEFLRIVGAYANISKPSPESILQALTEHRFFIALDNFEDVDDEDREQFIQFFEDIETSCKSRILITGRKDVDPDNLKTIRLRTLQSDDASQLLFERYKYLMRRPAPGMWDYKAPIFNALRNLRDGGFDFIQAVKEKLETKIIQEDSIDLTEVRDRLGHPILILRVAVELGRPDLPLDLFGLENEEERIVGLLAYIISSPRFDAWQTDLLKWVTDKAYEDIGAFPECVMILRHLQHHSATLRELKRHVQEQGGDHKAVSDAISRLQSHQILIRIVDTRYEATEQTMRYLNAVPASTTQDRNTESTKVADSIETCLRTILRGFEDGVEDFDAVLQELVGSEVPLERRKHITSRSFTMAHDIIRKVPQNQQDKFDGLLTSFATLCSERLSDKDDVIERGLLSAILIRCISVLTIDDATLTGWVRYLRITDVQSQDPNVRVIFSLRLLRTIAEFPIEQSVNLPRLLSLVAACGTSSVMLDSLKEPWSRLVQDTSSSSADVDSLVLPEVRRLLRRMSKTDQQWNRNHAEYLSRFEAEPQAEDWTNIRDWETYTCPAIAPPESLLPKLVIPENFDPIQHGLSYSSKIDHRFCFEVTNRPQAHWHTNPRNQTSLGDVKIEYQEWDDEKKANFTSDVLNWFEQLWSQFPYGFDALRLLDRISGQYGRPTEAVISASDGAEEKWLPWLEKNILCLPQFSLVGIEKRPQVMFFSKSIPHGVQAWLFTASPNTPSLPTIAEFVNILKLLKLRKKIPKSLRREFPYFLQSVVYGYNLLKHIEAFQERVRQAILQHVLNHITRIDCSEEERAMIDEEVEGWLHSALTTYQRDEEIEGTQADDQYAAERLRRKAEVAKLNNLMSARRNQRRNVLRKSEEE